MKMPWEDDKNWNNTATTIVKGEPMNRDCESCVYAKPYGGENDNRCSAWSCEYINKNEAIEAYKNLKEYRSKVLMAIRVKENKWRNEPNADLCEAFSDLYVRVKKILEA